MSTQVYIDEKLEKITSKDFIEIRDVVPKRSYKGEKYKSNSKNKKLLIKDFQNRCAYCNDSDSYTGGYRNYHVEHFAPKEKFPYLEFVYDNLLYSCPYCNISKSNKWAGETAEENIKGNKGFIDPCNEEYYKHLKRNSDGEIVGVTELGKYMYKELKLYLLRHKILFNIDKAYTKANEIDKKIEQLRLNNINNNEEINKKIEKLELVRNALSNEFREYFKLLKEQESYIEG